MTLHNVKSVVNKDKNHYYNKIFLERCSYQLAKKVSQVFVYSIIMVKFGKTEIAKEKFYTAKKSIKILDIIVDNIVISKLVKEKTNSKYLIGYLDKDIRPLVLIMSKMSGDVKTFKVEYKINKLMSFGIDGEKLLQKYKTIWTKI